MTDPKTVVNSDYARHPISVLAPTLFPFFRHTIANVRLAVVKTLQTFMTVPSLAKDWMTVHFLRLLFQNLIVEERADVRDTTLSAWRLVLSILSSVTGWMESIVTQQLLLEWYAVLMTPLGLSLDASAFYDPTIVADNSGPPERHNVDKNMLAQDLSLVTVEVVLKARIAAATALAHVIAFWPNNVSIVSACPVSSSTHSELIGAGRSTGRYVSTDPRPLY